MAREFSSGEASCITAILVYLYLTLLSRLMFVVAGNNCIQLNFSIMSPADYKIA